MADITLPTLLPEGLVTDQFSEFTRTLALAHARSVLLKPGVHAEQTSSNVAAFVDAQKTPVHAEIRIKN